MDGLTRYLHIFIISGVSGHEFFEQQQNRIGDNPPHFPFVKYRTRKKSESVSEGFFFFSITMGGGFFVVDKKPTDKRLWTKRFFQHTNKERKSLSSLCL